MDRRHLLALSGSLFAGAIAGCTATLSAAKDDPSGSGSPTPGTDLDGEEDRLAELVRRTNGFAFDLHHELAEVDSGENCLASPVSVSIALAMTYAGARGETRAQMRDVLGYTLEEDALHAAFADLQGALAERGGEVDSDALGSYDEDDEPVPFELAVENSAWGQAGYPFADEYLEVLANHYGGGLRETDFQTNAEGAREEINEWVAERTEDRIDDLLPEGSLDSLTRLVLVNAVYFLANWAHPFQEDATETGPFTALDGSTHEVPLMREQRSWEYAEVDGAQAVDLPYVGGDASMLVILPSEGSFESYERSFDAADLATVVDELEPREGTVRLPRFEFESGYKLGDTLERLGMEDAFDESAADFRGMIDKDASGEPLLIDDVYHDTYVAVDEEGTEAAAATGVVMRTTSAPADPFEFVADRPFLFVIRDRPTGAVLFLGRVVDPAGWN